MKHLRLGIQKVLSLFGYRFQSLYDSVIDNDPIFMEIYRRCKPYTMTTKERCYALYKSVRYIVRAGIEGDFVECGVWKGGSMMIVAYTLAWLEETDRQLYLYDTFEGMTPQTAEDHHVDDEGCAFDPSCSSYTEVMSNMMKTGYPMVNITGVIGDVANTIPNKTHKKIALLRLDTDWYESTKHELNHLYPLVSDRGITIIDDYGAWAGAKKATDEYFEGRVLLNRIDNDSIIIVN